MIDQALAVAAAALARGDPLAALKRVSLRDDAMALALRGSALAQLGDYPRARALLRRAARGFGDRNPLYRARCVVADVEVALALRELNALPRALPAAIAFLDTHADRVNATHARVLLVRRLLLLGRLAEATEALDRLDTRRLPPALAAIAALAGFELALRRLQLAAARAALTRATEAAARAEVPALLSEIEAAHDVLARPAARMVDGARSRLLSLDEVDALLGGGVLVIDGCRRGLRHRDEWRPLGRRPVLFALLAALARAWPGDVEREELVARAFGVKRANETHRARLRVEIGRLRACLSPLARIEATPRGYALSPMAEVDVALLLPPVDGESASLLALLADGAAWSSSALALALGTSQRTVQRELTSLEAAGQVRTIGRARTQRWLSPALTGFATILLLPAVQPTA